MRKKDKKDTQNVPVLSNVSWGSAVKDYKSKTSLIYVVTFPRGLLFKYGWVTYNFL
jgi:hypothetical protein